MSAITRRDILAHQEVVPWAAQHQVEQDLLLCKSMEALFNDSALRGQIAMRGGTLLHKVHLAPASRYSEDIDLVAVGDGAEEDIKRAIRDVLADVLGGPAASVWGDLRLALRNAVRPSRVLRMTYRLPSLIEPGRRLEIVVEANMTERRPHRPVADLPFTYPFREGAASTRIRGFEIHEMLGTKMRALFQRRRGRDLFDLYWALTRSAVPVEPAGIIESFRFYMEQEGSQARRRDFVGILDGHLADPGFCSDMESLLRTGISYEPRAAGDLIRSELLGLLP
jgi:predicted nucleotidyltransferase component of viral defense system